MPFCAQMRQGNACELCRRIREDADSRAARAQLSQRGADVGVSPEVDRCTLLGEALQQLPPIRQLLSNASTSTRKRRRASSSQSRQSGSVSPSAERLIATAFIVRAAGARRACRAATPTASIATSTGEAWRPRTKYWCSSSVAAYAIPTASASGFAAQRPVEQRAENGVLRHVRALPQDRVPRSEAGRKARDRGEREDDGGPHDDRKPDREESRSSHRRPMLVSGHKPASGKGIRCKSGTVPPL